MGAGACPGDLDRVTGYHPAVPPQDPAWLLLAVYLVSGFLLLAKGADWLVGGSSRIAARLGVSTLAIGLTVVAWGTSAPEVVVSSLAAYQGQSAISLGNVLGSNVANIGLVLGACAMVLPKVLESRLSLRDGFWFFASIAALWIACADGALGRGEAGLMLVMYGAYSVLLWFTARSGAAQGHVPIEEPAAEGERRWPAGLEAFIGFLAVALGAKLAVMGAEGGAGRLGVDERIVGLTVVAIGTSLPELAAGMGSALRGEADISIGNVVGSNVFNLIAVLGIVGLVRPLEPAAMPDPESVAELQAAFAGALSKDFYVVLGFSVAALLLPYVGGAKGGRWKGLALLVAYVVYTVSLFSEPSSVG